MALLAVVVWPGRVLGSRGVHGAAGFFGGLFFHGFPFTCVCALLCTARFSALLATPPPHLPQAARVSGSGSAGSGILGSEQVRGPLSNEHRYIMGVMGIMGSMGR